MSDIQAACILFFVVLFGTIISIRLLFIRESLRDVISLLQDIKTKLDRRRDSDDADWWKDS